MIEKKNSGYSIADGLLFRSKTSKKKDSVMDRIRHIRWKGGGKLFTCTRHCGIGHMAGRRIPETYSTY